ncbi:flavin reductase family protein [Micromonospora sp. NBC_01796]|uniref:flavin reductase family protein n=1 Tax=Micromonospora sp. NBC_01796 TaxID=2975987 RepID=UPI002DDB7652|nr:flavin reductase family protein [Micromonospora sp. NBC_01796]WSA85009.1 flavin reductase family protein [Micromonospora sp. NBC_01796]
MTITELDPVGTGQFRALLRRQAATVTVVTAPADPDAGLPAAGFTATSFTSVSLEPPLVSFCLDRGSSSWPTVSRAGYVAVHLLAETQQDVARTFAVSGIDRFAAHPGWQPGPHGVPLLHGVLTWLVCRVVDRLTAGDHSIVLAQPLTGSHGDDGAPLLYHQGAYAGLRETR